MDIQKYLNRIQASKKIELNLDFLSYLQQQHVLNVFFENLDILKKKPLSLQKESLYKKIVFEQRGGICYELNGLFFFLLEELGFKPSIMTGTVYVGNGIWAPENAHMFLVVTLENKEYLVDVGFAGICPRLPIPLNGDEVVDINGIYRVMKDDTQSMFFLQKKTDEEWETQYRFEKSLNNWSLDKLNSICVQAETSPESVLNREYFLSRVKENGRVTLLGNTFIVVNGTEKTKQKIEKDKIPEIVWEHFQLNL
ncbi:arylamine N-acetyltransferase family protein [Paenibacillus xylanilyticus]|uniref:arylamine N-acetyltransferase family protein n=1 Tax=Paenibacillus xylanilyticus TaxID=248903 RepID=UPI0039A29C0B